MGQEVGAEAASGQGVGAEAPSGQGTSGQGSQIQGADIQAKDSQSNEAQQNVDAEPHLSSSLNDWLQQSFPSMQDLRVLFPYLHYLFLLYSFPVYLWLCIIYYTQLQVYILFAASLILMCYNHVLFLLHMWFKFIPTRLFCCIHMSSVLQLHSVFASNIS